MLAWKLFGNGETLQSSGLKGDHLVGKYYVILPQVPNWDLNEYIVNFNAHPVKTGFQYNSGENTEWVGVEELRKLIKEYEEN